MPKTISARDKLHAEFKDLALNMNLDVDVISDGPLNAEVVIVGEGLGESEIRSITTENPNGTPFIGGSGRLLFDALRKHGLHRANVYLTNVVKRQISLSRTGDERHVVHKDELQRWQGLLQWELSQLPNARVILCLGNYALEALTGHTGITSWRGSVLDCEISSFSAPQGTHTSQKRTVKIVATINPAYAMREPKMEPMFLMDIHKLGMVLRGTFKVHQVNAIVNPSYKDALLYIKALSKSKNAIAFDVEVINMETACYGIGNSATEAMCINLRDGVNNRYTVQEEADILTELQKLCDSHHVVAQNGSFDAYWTRLHDYLCVTTWFDTLLAHHTLYPQLPHSLAFLVAQYTTHPYYKDEGKFWREGGDIDQFWRYNCTDVALTYAVYERLARELEQQGLSDFFFKHVMRAQPHLVSATVHGVAVDLASKRQITEQVSEDVARVKSNVHRLIHEATGDKSYYPNLDSWQQLQTLFYDRLNLKGRGRSTDESARDKLIEAATTPAIAKEIISGINVYRKENKFLGTYAESRVSKDGRFRCEYKQYGVAKAPGRLSSAKLLDGTGGNMQNQPVRARGMYIADPGTVFIYFDLAQAEARVVAWRANIPQWKEQFEQARIDGHYDAHCALAADLYKKPYDEVPKKDWIDAKGRLEGYPGFDRNTAQPTIRYYAKRARHALNYRMERFRLAEETGLPYHDASKLWILYHSKTPQLKHWWERTESDFRRTRVMYNALGRRWKVIQRLDDSVMDSIIAFFPQSTVGDKITQVWYQAEEDDDWPIDARVAIDVHDNLVGIATPKVAKTALSVLIKYAQSPIMVQDAWGGRPEPLIIPAEAKMSVVDEHGLHRWSNMKNIEL